MYQPWPLPRAAGPEDSIRGGVLPARRSLLLSLALAPLLPARALAATAQVLLVVGDSLSAEYGLPRGSGWVRHLEERLARAAPSWSVVNASISGDTTSGGRTRLPALLREHRPAVVILELGGNDGLRGLPIVQMRANLAAMAGAARDAGAQVVVVGMQIPPNYGDAYTRGFSESFAIVARAQHAALVPFLLEGFAGDPQAFQADGIHPLAVHQDRMAGNVWKVLAPLVQGKGG